VVSHAKTQVSKDGESNQDQSKQRLATASRPIEGGEMWSVSTATPLWAKFDRAIFALQLAQSNSGQTCQHRTSATEASTP
jgi:hypothetical protein